MLFWSSTTSTSNCSSGFRTVSPCQGFRGAARPGRVATGGPIWPRGSSRSVPPNSCAARGMPRTTQLASSCPKERAAAVRKPAPCHDAGGRSGNRHRDATIECSLWMPWQVRSTSGTDADDFRAPCGQPASEQPELWQACPCCPLWVCYMRPISGRDVVASRHRRRSNRPGNSQANGPLIKETDSEKRSGSSRRWCKPQPRGEETAILSGQ